MTDFSHEWLAKREQLEQATTEGPWWTTRDMSPADVFAGYGSADDVALATDIEEPADAAFIADARTSLPAARRALKAVLELHYPVEVEPSNTICGECSFQLPNGRYFGKIVEWPCQTVRAVETTLRNES